jgi:hypothetical protein
VIPAHYEMSEDMYKIAKVTIRYLLRTGALLGLFCDAKIGGDFSFRNVD